MKNLIAIVDDDDAVRASTALLLESTGIQVEDFASGDAFLEADSASFTCVVLDLRMPGTDGLGVLQHLSDRGIAPPVLVISGHGDVAAAVQAMKLGAYDFLEKPYAPADLLGALEVAFEHCRIGRDAVATKDRVAALLGSLSKRQIEVARGIVRGEQNKMIAFELHLSVRTVEAYRASILKKLGVRNTADLVCLLAQADWSEAESICSRTESAGDLQDAANERQLEEASFPLNAAGSRGYHCDKNSWNNLSKA